MRFANNRINLGSEMANDFQNASIQPISSANFKRKTSNRNRDSLMLAAHGSINKGTELKVVDKLNLQKIINPISPNLNRKIRSLNRAGSPLVLPANRQGL